VLASAGRLAQTLGVMTTLLRALAMLLPAVMLAASSAAAVDGKPKKVPRRMQPATEASSEPNAMPGRTERASACDLAALSETIELRRVAEPTAARAQLEAIRIATGQCTRFVLAVANRDEIRKFCAAPETYSAARTARELRRRIAAIDSDEGLRTSVAGQTCQASYKHELRTTRVMLRPGGKQVAQ
jgi:hypothetical protein